MDEARLEIRNARVAKSIRKAIDAHARSKNMGIDAEAHDELAAVIVRAVERDLRIPSGLQALLVDYDEETKRLTNPRLEDLDGRDVEEMLYPCDDNGEPLQENSRAAFVIGLPDVDCLPEI